MSCSWMYGNYNHVVGMTMDHSGNLGNNFDSYSSHMVVSDVDDFETSVVGAKDDTTSVSGEDDIKVGNSYHTSPIIFSSVLDQSNRVTPLNENSEETIARTTSEGNENIGNTNVLTKFPPLSHLTDDGKTVLKTQPRDRDSQDSSIKLVDEYTFKYDRSESTSRRHDLNTRQRFSNLEDTPKTRGQIHNNSIGENLFTNSHVVTDCNNIITSNDLCTNISNKTLHQQSHHRKHHLPNRKDSSLPKTNSKSTMPSKANSCLPRQRSRAIAIKRPCPGSDFTDTTNACENFADKEARRCNVELYDYATWRMYNRIIDHRRKHLMRIQHENDISQEQQQHHHDMNNKRASTSNQVLTASTIEEDNTKGMVHSSSTIFGQRCNVHHNMVYASDHHLSFSDDKDEIFDFEL